MKPTENINPSRESENHKKASFFISNENIHILGKKNLILIDDYIETKRFYVNYEKVVYFNLETCH